MDVLNLNECPICGLEYVPTDPHYICCSYACLKKFRVRSTWRFNGRRWLGAALYENDMRLGYRRPENWVKNEQDDLFCEFLRLMGRDT